jgi:hypothetical protein
MSERIESLPKLIGVVRLDCASGPMMRKIKEYKDNSNDLDVKSYKEKLTVEFVLISQVLNHLLALVSCIFLKESRHTQTYTLLTFSIFVIEEAQSQFEKT